MRRERVARSLSPAIFFDPPAVGLRRCGRGGAAVTVRLRRLAVTVRLWRLAVTVRLRRLAVTVRLRPPSCGRPA